MIQIKAPFIFAAQLAKKVIDDDLLALSNELAYKILLSIFPFMIFLVTLLGFLNLESSAFVLRLFEQLPADISIVFIDFISEVQERPSTGLLSISLLISIYSSSNGFKAVIRGVNKAHGYKDHRNFVTKTALCIALMLIFTFSIITMLVLWVFSDAIIAGLTTVIPFNINIVVKFFYTAIAFVMLVGVTALMYYLACARHGKGKTLPGACATVILWAISSNVFAIFVSQFSNISIIYGSIAGVFILIIWLNLIAFFLLLGNSVNALLNENSPK